MSPSTYHCFYTQSTHTTPLYDHLIKTLHIQTSGFSMKGFMCVILTDSYKPIPEHQQTAKQCFRLLHFQTFFSPSAFLKNI